MSSLKNVTNADLPLYPNHFVPRPNYQGNGELRHPQSDLPLLFTPLQIRGIRFKNRIGVSPMCQYSSIDGFSNDFHLSHLGAFARGGASLIIVEASGVVPEGRITPDCAGIWKDEHIAPLARIVSFCKKFNTKMAIQIAHAGRKASTKSPFLDPTGGAAVKDEEGGWIPFAPSPIAFDTDYRIPREMTKQDILDAIEAFGAATERAMKAGFDFVEIHGAHGYLIHEFLSPLSNHRTDEYGGCFENRIRFCVEVVKRVRKSLPNDRPLFLRLSGTDWAEGGWNVDETVKLVKIVKELGVDLVDCSSGGNTPLQKIPVGPGYQVHIAEAVKNQANITTSTVGIITHHDQCETILKNNQADFILVAREFLRNPHFAAACANAMKVDIEAPLQYERARPPLKK